MSAPGRRMDSPKGSGMDACAALCVPSRFVRSVAFACRAQGRHPFVPSRLSPVAHCTVHRPQCPIITGDGIAFRQSPFPGHTRPCRCAKRQVLSSGLAGALAPPSPQTFPTYLRKFPRRRDSSDLRARAFADAAVKVFQGGVLVNRLHGSLDQNPSQPRRALARN